MQTTSNGKITLKELCDITFPAFDLIDIKKVFNCYSSKKRIKKAGPNKPGHEFSACVNCLKTPPKHLAKSALPFQFAKGLDA